MKNPEYVVGYYTGHDDGYCEDPPKFHPRDKSKPFVAGYITGYFDGKEFRSIIESYIKKRNK